MIADLMPKTSFDLRRWEGTKYVSAGSVDLPDFRRPPRVLIIGNEVWLWDEFMAYLPAESVWTIDNQAVKPPKDEPTIPAPEAP